MSNMLNFHTKLMLVSLCLLDSIPETQMEEPVSQKTVVNAKMSTSFVNTNHENKRSSKGSTKGITVM